MFLYLVRFFKRNKAYTTDVLDNTGSMQQVPANRTCFMCTKEERQEKMSARKTPFWKLPLEMMKPNSSHRDSLNVHIPEQPLSDATVLGRRSCHKHPLPQVILTCVRNGDSVFYNEYLRIQFPTLEGYLTILWNTVWVWFSHKLNLTSSSHHYN